MMFSNLSWALMASLVLSTEARFKIVERDGRAIFPRRFGQEQGGGIPAEIGSACAGEICGVLGGEAISKLLAGNPPCGQQDHADAIIDAAKAQTDPAITANMIRLAVAFRQLEKNTPPDFTTNPPTNRNSLFCDKAPKNAELNGLVQAQDPANDPNLFFDPVSKTTVTLGAPGTFPFGTDGAAADPPAATEAATETAAETAAETAVETAVATETAVSDSTCPAPVTVTVTEGAAATEAATATETATEAAVTAPPAANPAPVAAGSLDFGSCTDPSLQFGPGFNGRKLSEFTFAPNNQGEFAQGEALNGNIVTNAICNILKDKCKASAEALTACDAGKAAFSAAFSATGSVSEKGGAADAFNAALGIQTDLATIQSAPGGGPGSLELQTKANFNKCSDPTITFANGIDGRNEPSFVPTNRAQFTQGSALNGNIVTRAICDTLINTCDANIVALNDCQAAIAATAGLTGQAFADAFNTAVLKNA